MHNIRENLSFHESDTSSSVEATKASQTMLEEANYPEKPFARVRPNVCDNSESTYCQPYRFAGANETKIPHQNPPVMAILNTGDVFTHDGNKQRLDIKEGLSIEVGDGTFSVLDREGRRFSADELPPQPRSTRRYVSIGNGAIIAEINNDGLVSIDLPNRSSVMFDSSGFLMVYRDTMDGWSSRPRRHWF